MEKFIIILVSVVALFACKSESPSEIKIEKTTIVKPLIDTNNRMVTEWYPGHKQRKTEGKLDADGKRHEVWQYYNQAGEERSITTYSHGKKNGFTVVYHPNGTLSYTGEYANDERVGEWKFYDRDGTLKRTMNY